MFADTKAIEPFVVFEVVLVDLVHLEVFIFFVLPMIKES